MQNIYARLNTWSTHLSSHWLYKLTFHVDWAQFLRKKHASIPLTWLMIRLMICSSLLSTLNAISVTLGMMRVTQKLLLSESYKSCADVSSWAGNWKWKISGPSERVSAQEAVPLRMQRKEINTVKNSTLNLMVYYLPLFVFSFKNTELLLHYTMNGLKLMNNTSSREINYEGTAIRNEWLIVNYTSVLSYGYCKAYEKLAKTFWKISFFDKSVHSVVMVEFLFRNPFTVSTHPNMSCCRH